MASHSGERKLLFPATKTNKSRLDPAACKGMDDIISFEQKAPMSLIFSTVFPPSYMNHHGHAAVSRALVDVLGIRWGT